MSVGQDSERALGRDAVPGLLVRLSLPSLVALLVTNLYNIVDTVFIGHAVGPRGLGAVTLSFPVQVLVWAVSEMIGIGAASVVARRLGEEDHGSARRVGGAALLLGGVAGAAMSVAGAVFATPILSLCGATPELAEMAKVYLTIVLLGAGPLSLTIVANCLIRAEGKARIAMFALCLGAVSNLILNPLFIYGFSMGVAGAAWATVIAQLISCVFVLGFYSTKHSTLAVGVEHLRLRWADLHEPLSLGLPELLNQLGLGLLLTLVNNLLRWNAEEPTRAIAGFGVILRVLFFAMTPLFSLTEGFRPIAGYSFGAGDWGRTRLSLIAAMLYATAWGGFASVVMWAMAPQVLRLFTGDQDLITAHAWPLRLIMASFVLVGAQLIGACFFQVIGRGLPALLLTLSRQVIFLVPGLILLSRQYGAIGIYAATPIADVLAFLVTMVWLWMAVRAMDHYHMRRAQAL